MYQQLNSCEKGIFKPSNSGMHDVKVLPLCMKLPTAVILDGMSSDCCVGHSLAYSFAECRSGSIICPVRSHEFTVYVCLSQKLLNAEGKESAST